MRGTCVIRSGAVVCAAAIAWGLPERPAGADEGVALLAVDLPGTMWKAKGTVTMRLSARGMSETTPTVRVRGALVDFVTADALVLFSNSPGDSVPVGWQPELDRPRHLTGSAYGPSLHNWDKHVEKAMRRGVRRAGGRNPTVELTSSECRLKGQLNRSGKRLRIRVRLKSRWSVQAGRSVNFRVRTLFRLRGKRVA
jgi:hypothetical protein